MAPVIDLSVGTTVFSNVIHLRGPRTRPGGAPVHRARRREGDWALSPGSFAASAKEVSAVTLDLLPDNATRVYVTARTKDGTRRILVEVTRQGLLAVGHQKDSSATSKSVVTVVGTGDASPTSVKAPSWRRRSTSVRSARQRRTRPPSPERTSRCRRAPTPRWRCRSRRARTTRCRLPSFRQAPPRAWCRSCSNSRSRSRSTSSILRRVRCGGRERARARRPAAGAAARGPNPARGRRPGGPAPDLARRAGDQPNGRKFFIVGRTDDLMQGGNLAENGSYNDGLADARAAAAAAALTAAGAASADITSRHEKRRLGIGTARVAAPSHHRRRGLACLRRRRPRPPGRVRRSGTAAGTLTPRAAIPTTWRSTTRAARPTAAPRSTRSTQAPSRRRRRPRGASRACRRGCWCRGPMETPAPV